MGQTLAASQRMLLNPVGDVQEIEVTGPDTGRIVVSDGYGNYHEPVRLVRLHEAPFTDRLVAKFGLPVEGWRGASERRFGEEDGG